MGGTPVTEQNDSGVTLGGSRDQANTHTHTLYFPLPQTCRHATHMPDNHTQAHPLPGTGNSACVRREEQEWGQFGNSMSLSVALNFSRHLHGSIVSATECYCDLPQAKAVAPCSLSSPCPLLREEGGARR